MTLSEMIANTHCTSPLQACAPRRVLLSWRSCTSCKPLREGCADGPRGRELACRWCWQAMVFMDGQVTRLSPDCLRQYVWQGLQYLGTMRAPLPLYGPAFEQCSVCHANFTPKLPEGVSLAPNVSATFSCKFCVLTLTANVCVLLQIPWGGGCTPCNMLALAKMHQSPTIP